MVAIEPITIIAAVVCLVLGAVIGFCYRKQIAEAKVGVAEKRANDIVEDAKKEEFCDSPRSERAQKFLSKILSH